VKGVTIWGYVQGFHWRNAQGAWLLYNNGGERPALQWMIRYVQNATPAVTAQTFTVSESLAGGSPIGTMLATDADAGTVFSQWQLTDPSGKFAIDASSGVLSLASAAALDFESAKEHTVSVSVWDGYVRSAPQTITIKVTNANDNAPAITAGQAFRIDDGYKQIIAEIEVSDPDDVNQVGFTKFRGYKIVSGDPGRVFKLRRDGELEVFAKEVDWSLTSYVLGATVSDGVNTSAVETITVSIPNRVLVCVADVVQLDVPKEDVAPLVAAGADLGACKYWE
jgi:VCBS repeat-containing protein